MNQKGGTDNLVFQIISNSILFKDFDKELVPRIASNFTQEIWPAHTCSNCHYLKHKFHIIASGRLKVFKTDKETGREFTIFLLSKNDFFDVITLLEGGPHTIYYEALEKVRIISIPMLTMQEWLREYPVLHQKLLPYVIKQLLTLEDYAINHTLFEIPVRLARLIIKNLNPDSKKLEFIDDLTNEEIANLIGSTRAVVNRHFQEFKKEGILKIGRKKMEVIDLPLLLKKASNHLKT